MSKVPVHYRFGNLVIVGFGASSTVIISRHFSSRRLCCIDTNQSQQGLDYD
jgi:hypothetical protein